MSNNYRFDVRSKDQFKNDIKKSHKYEAQIAIRLAIAIHSKTKRWPSVIPAGVDSTGTFIENSKSITSEPDFVIADRMVEITRSDVVCNKTFHQKKNKIKRCIEEGNDLVFVNGYTVEKQPLYIWLTSDQVEDFTIRAETKYGDVLHPGSGKVVAINKAAYRYDIFWFKDLWKPLPVLIEKLPGDYLDILDSTKV